MRKILLYKSKFGATEKYTQWIAEKIPELEVMQISDINDTSNLIANYDVVVIGSRTYMGNIQLAPWLKKNWGELAEKKVFLFVVGVQPEDDPESKKAFEKIPLNIRNKLNGYIKVPGTLEPDKLNFWDKMIVRMMGYELKDHTQQEKIEPVIEFLAAN